jgi:hypothetical protein
MIHFFLAGAPALARSSRVLLIASGEAALVRKIQAEAAHAGVTLEGPVEPAFAGEADLDAEAGSAVMIHVLSAHQVRLRFAAHDGQGAYETIVEQTPADGDGFATRVVEQVRGHLVELRLLPGDAGSQPTRPKDSALPADARSLDAPPPDARSPDAPLARGAPAAGPHLGVSVGASAAAAFGGVGVTPGLSLGLRVEPSEQWSVTAHALLPITENEVSGPEGEADLLVNLFLADVAYRLPILSSRWELAFGPGAGILSMPMSAETSAPRTASSDRTTSAVFFAHGGVGWSATPWLRARASLRAGVVTPRPVVLFDGREVAAWGHGFLAATLEAELTWSLGGGP